MRKLSAGLMAAILSAAPVAVADDTHPADSTVETFSWTASSEGARLGVMVMSLTPELRTYFGASTDKGVLVAKVEPHSAAAAAGIKVGDVLVQVKGNAVDDATDVIGALAEAKSGDKVRIELVRDKKPMALDATISGTKSSDRTDWFRHAFPWFESWRSSST